MKELNELLKKHPEVHLDVQSNKWPRKSIGK